MSQRISDHPGLLAPGEHRRTMAELERMCVAPFPLSLTRADIYAGFRRLVDRIIGAGIDCELVVDGSFLTEEIDPGDIDIAVVVSPAFFAGCSQTQREVLDWIGDDFEISKTHLCDCYLCIEYQPNDPQFLGDCRTERTG